MDKREYTRLANDIHALVLEATKAKYALSGWVDTLDPEIDAKAIKAHERQLRDLAAAIQPFKHW